MAFWQRVRNKIDYELTQVRNNCNRRAADRFFERTPVATNDRTLDRLINSECSMCRFGDGEFKVMAGGQNGFQKSDATLAKRLRTIVTDTTHDDLLICIPNVVEDVNIRTDEANRFWNGFLNENGKQWTEMLQKGGRYYNTQVTRLYMDYRDSGLSAGWFGQIKRVWEGKPLLIVEGEKTRLGIGNDLFSNAASIRRILAPSQNAFSYYDEILEHVIRHHRGELVLIALGMTATVLAYDLHQQGIRALDVGHIDIEYEWFLANAKEKTSIQGKYVKEVDDAADQRLEDPLYESQIVDRIGV